MVSTGVSNISLKMRDGMLAFRDASFRGLERLKPVSSRVSQFCTDHRVAIVGLAVVLVIPFNYFIASNQASIPSQPLEKYHQFPTWMHTDPIQALGLPAAVSPQFVPNRLNISRAHRKFRAAWSVDHWRQHNFSTQAEALKAYIRGEDARTILDDWYDNPFCYKDTRYFEARHQHLPKFAYHDGMPSFANPCRCTYPLYIRKQLELALIPFFLQSPVPKTEAALNTYCPCAKTNAEASWFTFNEDNQPPFLARIV